MFLFCVSVCSIFVIIFTNHNFHPQARADNIRLLARKQQELTDMFENVFDEDDDDDSATNPNNFESEATQRIRTRYESEFKKTVGEVKKFPRDMSAKFGSMIKRLADFADSLGLEGILDRAMTSHSPKRTSVSTSLCLFCPCCD